MLYFDENRIKMILETPERSLQGYPHTKIIWKMLQGMYARQTSLEKTMDASLADNEMGFDSYDAHFLSSVARNSKSYKNLTPRQAKSVAKSLKKYTRQLVEIANEHQPQKAPIPTRNRKKEDLRQMHL